TILYVLCAATIEVAVALDKLERGKIRRPVLTTSFNHVEMGKQQDWFASAFAMQACDQDLLALIGTADLHASRAERGRDYPASDSLSGRCRPHPGFDGLDVH